MGLIEDPAVNALIATIGGSNSASLVPYLDYGKIRAARKVIVGYSDITSLHLAILKFSGLSTFYGPAVVPSFGEWPTILEETWASFRSAVMVADSAPRTLQPFGRWSNHFIDAKLPNWRDQAREFNGNGNWRILRPGLARGKAVVANLNTLVSAAGTRYFPKLAGRILFLEEMDAKMSRLERSLRQLQLLGVLSNLAGLVLSKSETFESEGAPFGVDSLLLEVLGSECSYPVISDFDCGHTHPMITLSQMADVSIIAEVGGQPAVRLERAMVV